MVIRKSLENTQNASKGMFVTNNDHWLSTDSFVFTTNHIKITEKRTSLSVQTHKDEKARGETEVDVP